MKVTVNPHNSAKPITLESVPPRGLPRSTTARREGLPNFLKCLIFAGFTPLTILTNQEPTRYGSENTFFNRSFPRGTLFRIAIGLQIGLDDCLEVLIAWVIIVSAASPKEDILVMNCCSGIR